MKLSHLHAAILRQDWLIEPSYVEGQLPTIAAIIKGESVNTELKLSQYYYGKDPESTDVNPVIMSAAGAPLARYHWYSGYKDAPEGSIAVIPVEGAIMKYGYCGDPGTMQWAKMIQEGNNNPNIIGFIMPTDSPGGTVSGTQTAAQAIKASNKPVVAFVEEGMMASAAYWIGSQADYIIASQKTDYIGSIGVMTSLRDFSEYYEKMGIKITELYAPQSKNKNKDYKEAKEGNYDSIVEHLGWICEEFISQVKAGRGDKLSNVINPFEGDLYTAERAKKAGLIDEIASFDRAVAKVRELAGAGTASRSSGSNSKANSNSKNIMENPFKPKKYAALNALVGKEADKISAEELKAANDQVQAYGIKGVEIATAGLSAQLADLTKKASDAEQKVTDLNATLATANADVTKWKNLAEEYGAKDAELKTEATKGDDEIEGADPKVELTSWEKQAERAKARNKKPTTK